jgi:hypothetical protein
MSEVAWMASFVAEAFQAADVVEGLAGVHALFVVAGSEVVVAAAPAVRVPPRLAYRVRALCSVAYPAQLLSRLLDAR